MSDEEKKEVRPWDVVEIRLEAKREGQALPGLHSVGVPVGWLESLAHGGQGFRVSLYVRDPMELRAGDIIAIEVGAVNEIRPPSGPLPFDPPYAEKAGGE